MPTLELNPYDVLLEGLYGKGYAKRSALASRARKKLPILGVHAVSGPIRRGWSVKPGGAPQRDAGAEEERPTRSSRAVSRVGSRFARG